ncbi:MAG: ABC transporter permease, partial [bacterium]|nr:ABC transporter permease [bacterium]
VMAGIAFFFYHFNLFLFGFTLIPFVLNLLMFGAVLGLFTTAIILRYGTSAQVLAFGFIMLLQPFTAVFYPVSVLPPILQKVAYFFPSTYVFEGMRGVIAGDAFSYPLFWGGIVTNLLYAAFITWFFYRMFAYVKNAGKLLKLD